MYTRIGKVTNIYPATGKIKVMYEDEKNTSLPLSMLTMNGEYSMPTVGDRVVTVHMGNGSSKGFVLGTYYGGGTQPKANSGYRKDFGNGAYVVCKNGAYTLYAGSASFRSGDNHILLKDETELFAKSILIESKDGHFLIDVDMEIFTTGNITIESESDILIKAIGNISAESNGDVLIKITGNITVESESDISIKAKKVAIQADDIELVCSYGTITIEEMMKRLERIEDGLGLPHTI